MAAVPRKAIEAVEAETGVKVQKSDANEDRRIYFLADGRKLVETYDADTDEWKLQSEPETPPAVET